MINEELTQRIECLLSGLYFCACLSFKLLLILDKPEITLVNPFVISFKLLSIELSSESKFNIFRTLLYNFSKLPSYSDLEPNILHSIDNKTCPKEFWH